ncbi:alpha/beta hydrolase family protein [Pedobacter endophyticus]|uniref:Prolyl oligopeptidase family serine peptidase n=1 Tax=Pedobacter endophyticus TaxID=2789740 RepID=A0A7S9L0A4_9SPHI|nr:prolyl oligopeptidase family serine peptidase [Pedobacter endophyticus]QPH40105.1 prolyl oligopeptidase family serine peptidase [Pedobacter endophyticus]
MNKIQSIHKAVFRHTKQKVKVLFLLHLFLLMSAKSQAQKTDKFMGETVNYDEEAVPAYTLPDVLKTGNGKKITSRKNWEAKRRPEILSLFEENIYGKMPPRLDSLKFMISNIDSNAMNGKALLKEIQITVWRKGNFLSFPLVLFIPKNRTKPAPAFLLINNRSKKNTDPTRVEKSTFWPAEMIIDSGYAIAAFHNADVTPDRKDSYRQGLLEKIFPEEIQKPDGIKAIGAWAWAASRVMDYFQTDNDIDFNKVAIVGHSRGGKTALWAAAQDQRFAMVLSSCSGSTGAALARRRYGETVSLINRQFPHWFNDNYKKYNNQVDRLPVDQHMLIGLIAPRPVYVTNATEDRWADPRGSFLSLVNAKPVYDLYKKKTMLPASFPDTNSPTIRSAIGYHFRDGKHDLNVYDWTNFIKFANFNYKR